MAYFSPNYKEVFYPKNVQGTQDYERYDYEKEKQEIKQKYIFYHSHIINRFVDFNDFFHIKFMNEKNYTKQILTTEIEVDGGRHLSKFVLGFDLKTNK